MLASAGRSCSCNRLIGTEQLCSILKFACVHCMPVRVSEKLATVGHYLPLFVPSSSAAESRTMNGQLPDLANILFIKCKRMQVEAELIRLFRRN